MDIEKKIDGKKLTLVLDGRVDTVAAPELDKAINESIAGIEELVLDFDKVGYISSACLRVLLTTQKTMNTKGAMSIINANRTIQDVFEMTGFSTFVNIKYKR